MNRRILVGTAAIAAIAAILAVLPPAAAQTFPNRPVRFISASPSGGTPDVSTRLVAEKLAGYWKQPVTVEPRPGADGQIAIEALKRVPADGYSLIVLGNGHLAISPSLVKNLQYDPVGDFAPASLIFTAPFLITVSAAGPYNSVPELVAAARANPGKLAYGSINQGSIQQIAGAQLAHATATQMFPVFYKEGSQLNTGIANGDLAFAFWTLGSASAMVNAKRLKFIALAAPTRLASHPDIPTVAEAGGPPNLNISSWVGALGLRGTPADVLERISADMQRAMYEPDLKEKFRNLGLETAPSTPQGMAKFMADELAKYADIVKKTGL